jgi:hypothetical protein
LHSLTKSVPFDFSSSRINLKYNESWFLHDSRMHSSWSYFVTSYLSKTWTTSI